MQGVLRFINSVSLLLISLLIFISAESQVPNETKGVVISSGSKRDTISGNVYAIITGVSSYPGINPLKYADKDALFFRDFLQTPGGGNAKPENILCLINENAKAADFNVKAYSWLQTKGLKKGDRLYLYFSGHGDAMNEEMYFFLPYDCEPGKDDHNYLGTGNIDLHNVKLLFIKPQVKKGVEVFLIMDACRTNELPGGEEGQKSFANNFIAEQKMGDIIMLSTGAGQVSVESQAIGNGHGLFTYYLIDGLVGAADKDQENGDVDGRVSLFEISAYVKNKVKKRAKDDFKTVQIPYLCCEEKDLSTISWVQDQIYLAWENNKKLEQLNSGNDASTNTFTLSRQRGVGDMPRKDTALVKIYNRFVETLLYEKLTGTVSAESYYRMMEKGWPGNDLTEDARFSLASKLFNFCQQKINLFLAGKGVVNILDMEKNIFRVSSIDAGMNSFETMGENQINRLMTIVNTDFITASRLMGTAIELLKQDTMLIDPYWTRYQFLKIMGAYAERSGNLDTILEQCNWYIAMDPGSPAGYLLKGWIYRDMENDSCMYYFRNAAAIAPKWAYPANDLGNYYLSEGKYDSALYYFDRAIALDSLFSESFRNRGLAHLILGGYEGQNTIGIPNVSELNAARKDLVYAKKINPKDCYAPMYFADHQMTFLKSTVPGSQAYKAYSNNAKINYQQAIDCNPDLTMGYQKMADFYAYLGKTDSGLVYLQQYIKRNSKDAAGYRNLGNYYLRALNDTLTAIDKLQKAIELDPTSGGNYFSLARLYRKMKEREKALSVYLSAEGRIGNYKDLYNEMGNTYFEDPTNFDQAAFYYKKALTIDSTLGYVCYNLGKLYQLKRGSSDSAYYYYGKACFYNPYRFRNLIHPIADHYYYSNQYSEAKPLYKLALRFPSSTRNGDIERLIQILINEHSITEAKRMLNQYLSPKSDKDIYMRLTTVIEQASKKD